MCVRDCWSPLGESRKFGGPRICATFDVFRRFIGPLQAAYESPTMHVELPSVHMHATRDPHQRTHCTQHT